MLKRIGYHCSLERYTPSQHLKWAKLAEDVGFEGILCSDHFAPWSEQQGASVQAWAWLGAAMQAVSLPFCVVTAPVQRYHPVIVAQAMATLANLFEGRLTCAFGSGQWLNEHVIGAPWPEKNERNLRLKEAVEIIRILWRGETLSYKGKYFQVDEAKLYTLPHQTPLILGAALSNHTAEFIGAWADGLITTSKPSEQQKAFIESFHKGGGLGKPLFLQAIHSYARNQETALQQAHLNWHHAALGPNLQSELKTPLLFDEASKPVKPEQLSPFIRISADLEQHLAWLEEDVALGFENIYLQNVSSDPETTLIDFGKVILPALKKLKQNSR